jgi:hypothetical protein
MYSFLARDLRTTMFADKVLEGQPCYDGFEAQMQGKINEERIMRSLVLL